MQSSRSATHAKCLAACALFLSLTAPAYAHAGPVADQLMLPVLFAKSWFIGYGLVFLAVLLGLLALLIPSRRKTLRRRG